MRASACLLRDQPGLVSDHLQACSPWWMFQDLRYHWPTLPNPLYYLEIAILRDSLDSRRRVKDFRILTRQRSIISPSPPSTLFKIGFQSAELFAMSNAITMPPTTWLPSSLPPESAMFSLPLFPRARSSLKSNGIDDRSALDPNSYHCGWCKLYVFCVELINCLWSQWYKSGIGLLGIIWCHLRKWIISNARA